MRVSRRDRDATVAADLAESESGVRLDLSGYGKIDLGDDPGYKRNVQRALKLRQELSSGEERSMAGSYRLTDVGNGQRFAADHQDAVRYCHQTRRWLVWDSRRWNRDAEGAVERLAKETVRGIYAEAAETADPDARRRLAAWAARSESRDRIAGMIWAATSEDGISVKIDELDTDPWSLNLLNGTLNLRTGLLRPHRRQDLITRLVPVVFDRGSDASRWGTFLGEITNGDLELEGFIRRMFGYSLTGVTVEHCLFILWGHGRNGKSVVLAVLRAILGDYIRSARSETFMLKREDGGATPALAKLKGARVVTSTETEDGRSLAEALIKEVTGGDVISARHLYAEEFDFRPEFKIWIASNNRPTIRGTDPAIWSRIRMVPFNVSFLGREDRGLTETLMHELPGILAWAVTGSLDWQREGLNPPDCVRTATREYQNEQDTVAHFLAEEAEEDPDGRTTSKDLYGRFVEWHQGSGVKGRPLSNLAFGRRLTARGFVRTKGSGGERQWTGLRLNDPTL
jgi:putative DNA primase/helicase